MEINVYVEGNNKPRADKVTIAGMTLSDRISLTRDGEDTKEVIPKSQVIAAGEGFNANELNQTNSLPESALPAFTGDATSAAGSATFTLKDSGVSAGTWTKFTVNSKGVVTSAGNIVSSDLPNLDWSAIIPSSIPTTISGFGITDAVEKTSTPSKEGNLVLPYTTPATDTDAATYLYAEDRLGNSRYEEPKIGSLLIKTNNTGRDNFISANGAVLNKATYPALYTLIGDSYDKTRSAVIHGGSPEKYTYDYNKVGLGTIGTFTEVPVSINGSTTHYPSSNSNYEGESFVSVYEGKVYWLRPEAGITDSKLSSTISIASINPDGTIGNFVDMTPALNVKFRLDRKTTQMFVCNDYLWIIGKSNYQGSATGFSSRRIQLNASGPVGSWVTPPGADSTDLDPTTGRPYYDGMYFSLGGAIYLMRVKYDYADGTPNTTVIFSFFNDTGNPRSTTAINSLSIPLIDLHQDTTQSTLTQGSTKLRRMFWLASASRDLVSVVFAGYRYPTAAGSYPPLVVQFGIDRQGTVTDFLVGSIRFRLSLSISLGIISATPTFLQHGDKLTAYGVGNHLEFTVGPQGGLKEYSRATLFQIERVYTEWTQSLTELPTKANVSALFTTSSKLYLLPGERHSGDSGSVNNTFLVADITGGSNIPQSLHDWSIITSSLDPAKFIIPDLNSGLRASDLGVFYYIKAL